MNPENSPSEPMQALVADLRRVMREQDARQLRRHRRWLPWVAAAVVGVGAPSIAAATGALSLGDNTLADGSTFTHTVVTSVGAADSPEAVTPKTCDVTRIDGPGDTGAISGDGCGPTGAQTTDPVAVLSVLGERADTTVVSGIVSPAIASLTFVAGERDQLERQVALEARPNDERHSFTFVARRSGGTLVAANTNGREVGRATVPALPDGTPALYPFQP